MSGINLHIILGNVGKIETRYAADGKAIVNMSVATSEKWKDTTGQPQEKTEWHRVVVFGKPAEIISQYVNKGDKIYLSGKCVTRKWQHSDGTDRYSTETVVDGFNGKFELIGGKPVDNTEPKLPQPEAQQGATSYHPPNMPDTSQFRDDELDDLPF